MMSIWRATGGALLVVVGMGCSNSRAGEGAQLSFDRVEVEIGLPSRALLTSDVDGDGRLDLIVAGGDRVLVLKGHGRRAIRPIILRRGGRESGGLGRI